MGFEPTDGGNQGSVPFSGGPNNQGQGNTDNQGITSDPFDLPRFSGPFSAPLTQGQLDILSGFQQMFTGQPVIQSSTISQALQRGLSGDPIFNPNAGATLSESIDPFNLGSSPVSGAGDVFNLASSAPSFDNTDFFQNQEQVFSRDLDRHLARIREESSALGLGPGSSDREVRLADAAGDALSRFRVGQLDQGRQSFEAAENRRLGSLQFVPGLEGAALAREDAPFTRFRDISADAIDRRTGLLGLLPEFSNLPFNQATQIFGINEAARQVADTDITRRLGDQARVSGGQLNQLFALLGQSPLTNTNFSPSGMSQFGDLLGGLARFIPLF